jgi:MFS family permease
MDATTINDFNEESSLLSQRKMDDQALEQDQMHTYPDGDRKSWTVLFGCFCAFLPALSMLNSLGAYQAWLASHQLSHYQPAIIGWIFSFYSFFSFFAGLFIGPLFDGLGPRPLTIVGGILTLLTYVLMGSCHSYYQFFLCIGVIGGLGTCSLFTAAVGTVQH